jgi:small subunit ribosomal protein S6
MRPYELVVLLHPDLEIDADTPIKKIEGQVEAAGGKVVSRDNWGKKRTAYKVKKQDFAVYVRFELQIDPAKVRGFENNLLLTEEVIRHLLVTKETSKATEKPEKAKDKSEDKEKSADQEDKTDKEEKEEKVTAAKEEK